MSFYGSHLLWLLFIFVVAVDYFVVLGNCVMWDNFRCLYIIFCNIFILLMTCFSLGDHRTSVGYSLSFIFINFR